MLKSTTSGLSGENGKRQLFLSVCNKSVLSPYYQWEMCCVTRDYETTGLRVEPGPEVPKSRRPEVKTDCILLLNS